MRRKTNVKIVCFTAFAALLLVCILLYVFLSRSPKTPATVELVTKALEENGFVAVDLTEQYREKWEVGDTVVAAVCTEKEDIRFDFFVFDSEQSAEHIRKQYQSYIRENRYDTPNIIVDEGIYNYILYTIKAKEMYTVNMRVENTLVFAYCNAENMSYVQNIMKDIGYFEK